MAELRMITGPMRCGKTTQVICEARKISAKQGTYIVFIVHSFEQKRLLTTEKSVCYANGGLTWEPPSNVLFMYATKLGDISQQYLNIATHIIIDEIQFFNAYDAYTSIKNWLCTGKNVITCGLRYDFMGRRFNTPLALEFVATHIELLTGLCSVQNCPNKSVHTAHKHDIHTLPDQGSVIGGLEQYDPMCVLHFSQHLETQNIMMWPPPLPRDA